MQQADGSHPDVRTYRNRIWIQVMVIWMPPAVQMPFGLDQEVHA